MKKIYLTVILLISTTLISVGVSIWALFVRTPTVLVPDYALPETEKYAEIIPNERGDRAPREENGGSVSLHYSDQVTVEMKYKSVHLYFANPQRSNHDMVLQIVIQDEIIAKSGLITSGNRITKLDLPDGAEKRLSPGGYDGKFVIYYYDSVSGARSMMSTEIPIVLTVKTD